MAEKIVVSLKRHDRVEDVIPYIEEIAKAGMQVIFLIPYPVEALWLRDHWITTESLRETVSAGRKINERYSWEAQRGLAEQRVLPARKALDKREVEVAVDLYTGSLRRVIGDYAANGDVHLIMMGAGSGNPVSRFLWRLSHLFGSIQRPTPPPVLLLHPR